MIVAAGSAAGVKAMTVHRTEVEKALDDLISYEEGMKFQSLAVILAKQRWQDLVACERKKDLGADAIGEGKALACSITGTLGKLKGDARKIKKNFPEVRTLIFATAANVTNSTTQEWAVEIRDEFDYDLVLMPREDIITSLLDPSNAPLCRNHLGIQVSVEEGIKVLGSRAREAASDVIASWSARQLGKPLIELRLVRIDQEGRDTTEVIKLGDLRAELKHGRRVIIEAPAGRGKTTTLIQLATGLVRSESVPVLVDLPAWIGSGIDVLEFIGGMPQFRARSLNADPLAKLYESEHFSFLLNGWNEIAESDSLRAVQVLRELERRFPSAGILVASRTHHIVPPLPGSLRLKLLSVTRAERTRYLTQRLGSRSAELRATIENDSTLDDLTRTPLMLSEVTTLFGEGAPIPKTKMGVLEGTVRLNEGRGEHSGHLAAAPLFDRSTDYLTVLATTMSAQGAVAVPEEEARSLMNFVSAKLHSAGQIAAPPEPSEILNALCAHHVLERIAYPAVAFRFEHQQFQEYYAASLIKQQLMTLAQNDNRDEGLEFAKRYVNVPEWSEPLRMVAEEIGRESTESPGDLNLIRAGAILIRTALMCDPVFASELSYLCGPLVWQQIRGDLTARLRFLYQAPDKSLRELALAGMIATGSDEFKDVLLPLLASDSQQTRLATYRSLSEFHLSSLGPDWPKVVSGWKEEVRAEFVSDLLHFGKSVRELVPIALADNSLKVRVAAISALAWISSPEDFGQVLSTLDEGAFNAAVPELSTSDIPIQHRAHATTEYLRRYSESTDPHQRLRLLLHVDELGGANVSSQIKSNLDECPPETVKKLGEFVLKPALDIVRRTDPEWVSQWVAKHIVEGALWHEEWITLVRNVPKELKEKLLHRLETEDLQNTRYHGSASVLAASADPAQAQRVFAKLCELRQIIAARPDQRHEHERSVERQLEELFRKIPVKTAVQGVLMLLSGEVKPIELTVVSGLLGRVDEDSKLRTTLDSRLRQGLRAYLLKSVPTVLRENDFDGNEKGYLASAIAQVGEPEDLAVLRELIRADIERVRKGREAYAKGDRTRLGHGGVMSYANWHVRAVALLAPESCDTVLLDLLKEPEYERDAAGALARLTCAPRANAGLLGARRNYEDVWEAREGKLPACSNEERRKRYATAIAKRVAQIVAESEDVDEKAGYAFRLGELTKVLAQIDSGSTDLILRALSVPGRFNGWSIVQTLETLLFNGAALPTDAVLKLYDSIEEQVGPHLYSDQEVGLLIHALCLLPYVDNPSLGIGKVRDAIRRLKPRSYQLRDLTTALGHSRCSEAFGVLCELASDELNAKQLGDPWINAIAALDSPESRQLLLSTVDPKIAGLTCNMPFDHEDTLAARLVELARRDSGVERHLLELCSLPVTSAKRSLLAKVISCLGTRQAALAALELIDDNSTPQVPHETWRQIEATFVEHKPDAQHANAYTLAPQSSNEVRARLFEMAKSDHGRMKAASCLLAQIEVWRLEHGRPFGEPRHPAIDSGVPWPPAVTS
jgi:hypothetical protein